MARPSASQTMCRCRRSISRASAPGASWRSAPCLPPAPSSAASPLPATTCPASCWARRCGAISTASAWRQARVPWCSPPPTMAGRRRAILPQAGIAVAAVVDPRAEGIEKQGAGPWPVFAGAVVKEARGGQKLRSVIVRDDKGVETEIACDLLAVSNGWNPTLHLTCHLGGKPVWQEALARLRSRVQAQGPGRGRRRGRASLPRRGA